MTRALILACVIVVVIILMVMIHRWRRHRKPSLYDRLGGVYAIAAVVDHFSDALVVNPIVGRASPNTYLAAWYRDKSATRLAGLKFMRTLWLCGMAGGPFKYVPTKAGRCPFSLESAHKDLQISPAEFDAVAQELSNSLDHFKVPPAEHAEVLAAFAAHKPDVINGYQLAHAIATTPIKC